MALVASSGRTEVHRRVRPHRKPAVIDRVVPAATAAVGIGIGLIVVRDGSPLWQIMRLLAVTMLAGAAWGLLRSSARPLRAATAFCLSLVAIPVGVGVGAPHLSKTGLTLETVAGVLAFVGGTVLFASAVVTTLRSPRRRVRWAAVLAAVVVVVVMTWSLGQAVAATNVPRPAVASRTPAALGLNYRSVGFDATDGVRLSGWYIPSKTGAAVVLLHGAGSTRSNVLPHAAVLASHGYGVLLFDARGHGRSDGRAMDFGWFGDRDVGGAVAFLTHQPDVDRQRIAAVGMSMGGEQAIGASAAVDAIRAVVAEGATNRVAADKEWLSDQFGVRGAVTEAVNAMTYGFTDLFTEASPPTPLREAVRAADRPTLLIAAGSVPDEPRASRYIQSGAPGNVDVWVVRDAGHTDALEQHPHDWEQRVVEFLDRAIGS